MMRPISETITRITCARSGTSTPIIFSTASEYATLFVSADT
jgi:hypothetical protein